MVNRYRRFLVGTVAFVGVCLTYGVATAQRNVLAVDWDSARQTSNARITQNNQMSTLYPGINSVRIPVLAPVDGSLAEAMEDQGLGNLVAEKAMSDLRIQSFKPFPDNYFLTLAGPEVKVRMSGTRVGFTVDRSKLQTDSKTLGTGEDGDAITTDVNPDRHTLDASFTRFGASYLVFIECTEPPYAACEDDVYAKSIIEKLELVGGSPDGATLNENPREVPNEIDSGTQDETPNEGPNGLNLRDVIDNFQLNLPTNGGGSTPDPGPGTTPGRPQ